MSWLLVTCRAADAVERYYLPAVRAGGWSGAVRLLTPGDRAPRLDGACGLLLTGGNDIHPGRWDPSEPVHPAAEIDGDRDELEHPLVQAAWEARVPILGICRGIQVLNVALGGSLHQDVPSWFGCPPERHRGGSAEDAVLCHQVTVAAASRLAGHLGCAGALPVNSRHHQAVRRVAPPLAAVAWDRSTCREGDCLIEGVEASAPDRWAIGVQWHPETLVQLPGTAGAAARALFAAFATALAARAASGPAA